MMPRIKYQMYFLSGKSNIKMGRFQLSNALKDFNTINSCWVIASLYFSCQIKPDGAAIVGTSQTHSGWLAMEEEEKKKS